MAEFMPLMENWDGFVSLREKQAKFSESAVASALELLLNTGRMASHRHEYLIREAITTSDFPALFGFIVDRQMMAKYSAWVPNWRAYCATGLLPNFNQAEYHKVSGNDEYLPLVPEKTGYPAIAPVNGHYHRQVFKHGRSFDISWEAQINDILNAFSDLPERFATAAIRTVARDVTDTFASAAGPDVALFGAPIADVDGANVTNLGVLALDVTNLAITLELMAMQRDANLEPISVRGVHLVVPPALELLARSILTSTLIQAGAALPVPTVNVIAQMGIQLHVDPYLPIVDTSGNRNGTWYLFADPSQGKAMQMDFLRGYENPDICMKASDRVSVSGAAVSPMDGDFASDNTAYRVRIIHGGAAFDPRYAYAQVHA